MANYLRAAKPPAHYLEQVKVDAGAYRGFNLLVGNSTELHWHSNRSDRTERLSTGVQGRSNLPLITPWPKIARLK